MALLLKPSPNVVSSLQIDIFVVQWHKILGIYVININSYMVSIWIVNSWALPCIELDGQHITTITAISGGIEPGAVLGWAVHEYTYYYLNPEGELCEGAYWIKRLWYGNFAWHESFQGKRFGIAW